MSTQEAIAWIERYPGTYQTDQRFDDLVVVRRRHDDGFTITQTHGLLAATHPMVDLLVSYHTVSVGGGSDHFVHADVVFLDQNLNYLGYLRAYPYAWSGFYSETGIRYLELQGGTPNGGITAIKLERPVIFERHENPASPVGVKTHLAPGR